MPALPITHALREHGPIADGFQQAVLLQVPAGLDADRLTGALQALLDHHDALRARYLESEGGALHVRRAAR